MLLFTEKDKSVNDNAIHNLPAGENVFKILPTPTLKRKQGSEDINIAFDFETPAGERVSHFFCIAGSEVRARIGREGLRGLWDACGLSGTADVNRLPNFVGKFVRIRVEHQEKDGKTFANIREVHKATAEEFVPTNTGEYNEPGNDDDNVSYGDGAITEEQPADEQPAEDVAPDAPDNTPAPASKPAAAAAPARSWRPNRAK